MHRALDTPPSGPADLPDAADPGYRFLGPRARPVAAARRARPLLEQLSAPARLDGALALAFLSEGRYDAHRSFYRGLALAPARCPLQRGPDGVLEAKRGGGPSSLGIDAQAAAARVRALVDAAVERALVPHARAGVWLSGGLDSSAVAAAAAQAWRRLDRDPADLRLYHHLPRTGSGEAWAAHAVAAHLGHALCALRADARDPFEETESLFAELEFPPDGGGPRTSVQLAQRMREDGIGVFLTGDGGDELFGPLPPPTLRARVSGRLPDPLRRTLRRMLRPSQPPPAGLEVPRSERVLLQDRPRPRAGLGREAAVRDASVRNARQAAIVSWLRALGRSVGIEAACPLLDASLADWVVRLPQRLHRGSAAKPVLRNAVIDRLPAPVLRREGDQPAWEPQHLQDLERYGDAWRSTWLAGGMLEAGGVVARDVAGGILRRARSGRAEDVNRALGLLGLEIWCRGAGLDVG